ncbi:MAG: hypothetical protein HQL20_06095 [Candidatus Omnitrophica bacterium]|nr:hypothetical protein [Candidatus Omnitrophota bacterium]
MVKAGIFNSNAKYIGLGSRITTFLVLAAFLLNSLVLPAGYSYAQGRADLLPPGAMAALSPAFAPAVLKGIKVYPDDPLRLEFILDPGDRAEQASPAESSRLVKYFLAALTIPDKDLWVNLSPYEKDRIIPAAFGRTEMGRDLLAQDYLLKQITASVIYPEGDTGKKFWSGVYRQAQEKYGTTDIPVDAFNKVWIIPAQAEVYENPSAATAYVVASRLKVMLEADYLATSTNAMPTSTPTDPNDIARNVLREIVIPVLEKEVNEGAGFAPLRQVYQSLILATWYKKKIKDSILALGYAGHNKVDGVNIRDPQESGRIWEQYVATFRKGAYNLIKEEYDPGSQQIIPRKYFTGGVGFVPENMDRAMAISSDPAMISRLTKSLKKWGALLVFGVSLQVAESQGNFTPLDRPAIGPDIQADVEYLMKYVVKIKPEDKGHRMFSPFTAEADIPEMLQETSPLIRKFAAKAFSIRMWELQGMGLGNDDISPIKRFLAEGNAYLSPEEAKELWRLLTQGMIPEEALSGINERARKILNLLYEYSFKSIVESKASRSFKEKLILRVVREHWQPPHFSATIDYIFDMSRGRDEERALQFLISFTGSFRYQIDRDLADYIIAQNGGLDAVLGKPLLWDSINKQANILSEAGAIIKLVDYRSLGIEKTLIFVNRFAILRDLRWFFPSDVIKARVPDDFKMTVLDVMVYILQASLIPPGAHTGNGLGEKQIEQIYAVVKELRDQGVIRDEKDSHKMIETMALYFITTAYANEKLHDWIVRSGGWPGLAGRIIHDGAFSLNLVDLLANIARNCHESLLLARLTEWQFDDLQLFMRSLEMLGERMGVTTFDAARVLQVLTENGSLEPLAPDLPAKVMKSEYWEKVFQSPDLTRRLFEVIGSRGVGRFLKENLERHRGRLSGLTLVLPAHEMLQPGNFNLLIYSLSHDVLFSPEQQGRLLGDLVTVVLQEKKVALRSRYMFYLCRLFASFSNERKHQIRSSHPEVVALEQYSLADNPDQPDYTRMDKTKTFNVRLYNPFNPEYVLSQFAARGYDRTAKDGINILSKTINGVLVTVYHDPTGDPQNYKGAIFKEMSSPDVDMVAFSGHTGMGASLAFALDQAPSLDLLQMGHKIIGIFSCGSASAYLAPVMERFPYSHFIGATTTAYMSEDTATLMGILDALPERLSWPQIEARVKSQDGRVQYIFPHSNERKKYMYNETFGDAEAMLYLPSRGFVLSNERDSFAFELANVDLARLRHAYASDVGGRVRYFFGFNDYLKEFATNITISGFEISYVDSQAAVLGGTLQKPYPGEQFSFGINAGYWNASPAVLSMMALHELNLYFSRLKSGDLTGEWKPDGLDILRSLQMVAEFVKYYHKEDLFEIFVQKYSLPAIRLELLLQTLDSHSTEERVKALQEVLNLLDSTKKVTGSELKAQGLLSYSSDSIGFGEYESRYYVNDSGKVNPYAFFTGDWKNGQFDASMRGGIDLTPAPKNVKTSSVAGGVKFNVDPAMLQRVLDSSGISPVITGVHPLISLPQFLGIRPSATQPNVAP